MSPPAKHLSSAIASRFAILIASVAPSQAAAPPSAASSAASNASDDALTSTQIRKYAAEAIVRNRESTSMTEWLESGFTPRDVLMNARAMSKAGHLKIGKTVCAALSSLGADELPIFEGEVRAAASETLPCRDQLIAAIDRATSKMTAPSAPAPSAPAPARLTRAVKLVFEGRPEDRTTEHRLQRVGAALRKQDVKATFFFTGRSAERAARTVMELSRAGHAIGSQTYRGDFVTGINPSDARREIEYGRTAVGATIEARTTLFRFPGGLSSPLLEQEIGSAIGMTLVPIDVDSRDWQIRDPGELVKRTLAAVDAQKGGAILLHDDLEQTVLALPALLDGLKGRGTELERLPPPPARKKKRMVK